MDQESPREQGGLRQVFAVRFALGIPGDEGTVRALRIYPSGTLRPRVVQGRMGGFMEDRFFEVVVPNPYRHVPRVEDEETAQMFGKGGFVSFMNDSMVKERPHDCWELPDRLRNL